MKKIALLLTALILSIILAELSVRYVFNYPNYVKGTRYFTQNPNAETKLKKITWRPPGFKVFNVEGGNIVVKLNNLGFPGIDVKQSEDSKYIHVVGSSFTEALQVAPQNCATSVFQSKLNSLNDNLQVLNLGYSGNDIYLSWFRSMFFSKQFPPDFVIIILESQNEEWLNRYPDQLDFTIPENFGAEIKDKGVKKIVRAISNYSYMFNLLSEGFKKFDLSPDNAKNEVKSEFTANDITNRVNPKILQALQNYRRICPNILLVSVITNNYINSELKSFCQENGLQFASDTTILDKVNRLSKGTGHLNINGNRKLGLLLSDAFKKAYKKTLLDKK
ncbi:MAG: hypothetical protein JXR56_07975 [Candidatus Cloacimonetes bacterium]|nr:hypothetical protein [Candidatus Cloacimonadota bacterium]